MGRRNRLFESDGIYFLTNRCAEGRYLLTPGPELNNAIETLMARYSTCHGIELLGWMFMGNHFHIIAGGTPKAIPDFMRDFQSTLSDRIQDLREDWDRSVFPERYSSEPILDDAKLREKLLYVWMNPVRAGLVRHPDDWPGVSSVELHRDGDSLERNYLDHSKLRRLQRNADDGEAVDPKRAMRTHELEVTNPPALADQSVAEAGADLRGDLEALCNHWTDMTRVSGDEFAGPDRVRNQDPYDRPAEPPETPEPLCLTSCPDKREAYRAKYANVVDRYERAMEKWRAGDPDVTFPPGTYPPGWMRAARHDDFTAPDGANDGTSEADDPRGDPDETDRAA